MTTARALAQPGGQVALGVAPAIICVIKPTWNMKQRLVREPKRQRQRLERQKEFGHQSQAAGEPCPAPGVKTGAGREVDGADGALGHCCVKPPDASVKSIARARKTKREVAKIYMNRG